MLQEKMLKPLEFEFHGKAGEYFRIWIVNVLLTILNFRYLFCLGKST